MVQLNKLKRYGWPCNTKKQVSWFRLLLFRSPLLKESQLISFPPPTKMFQFGGYRLVNLCIQLTMIIFQIIGFPHSEIPGSKLYSSSPRLIAGLHVLHRLLMPRHPPVALNNLTQNFGVKTLSYESSKYLRISNHLLF